MEKGRHGELCLRGDILGLLKGRGRNQAETPILWTVSQRFGDLLLNSIASTVVYSQHVAFAQSK